jgi:hypothetical protein
MSPAKSSDLAARLKASAAGSRAVQAEAPSEPTPVPAVEKHDSITRIMVKMPKAQHRFIRVRCARREARQTHVKPSCFLFLHAETGNGVEWWS